MKFGFIVDSGGMGGAERQAMILADQLLKGKHEVIFFFLNQSNETLFGSQLSEKGIPYYDLGFSFSSSHIGRIINILKLMLKLRKFKIEILMPYTIRPNVNVNFFWQLTGAKCCIWNQRDEGRGFSKQKYRDKILWIALKNTSGFISNSQDGFQFLKSYIPETKPMITVNNGILVNRPESSREQVLKSADISPNAFIAIMVANLTQYKDHFTLVKAWKQFIVSIPDEKLPILFLAGKPAETADKIKLQISSFGLEEHVRLLGTVEDINSLIHASDLCLFSSLHEGVPNGILESMAASKAVIASDIPGIREALGSDYPHLFKPEDHLSMANHISELFKDEERRNSLGKRNKVRIVETFSVENLHDETLKFINNLLDEKD